MQENMKHKDIVQANSHKIENYIWTLFLPANSHKNQQFFFVVFIPTMTKPINIDATLLTNEKQKGAQINLKMGKSPVLPTKDSDGAPASLNVQVILSETATEKQKIIHKFLV